MTEKVQIKEYVNDLDDGGGGTCIEIRWSDATVNDGVPCR